MLGLLNLRQAVILANSTPGADFIEFGGFAGAVNEVTEGPIQITEGVTIGKPLPQPGTTQTAAVVRRSDDVAPFRIFEINLPQGAVNDKVEFEYVWVTNGVATAGDPNGGGVKSTNANLVFSHSQVMGNVAMGDGGGIWARGDVDKMQQLVLDGSDTRVFNNQAEGNGGGVAGTNIYIKMANTSEVRENTARLSGGGIAGFAFGWGAGKTLVEIKNGIIDNNMAVHGDGGGLFTTNDDSAPVNVTLQTALIKNNKAYGVKDSSGNLVSGGLGGGFCTFGVVQLNCAATTEFISNGQGSPVLAPQIGVYLDPLTIGGVNLASFSGNYVFP